MTVKEQLNLRALTEKVMAEEEAIRIPAERGAKRQHKLGRLLVRERIAALLDKDSPFFELNLWAGHEMYPDWGDTPAAGIVSVIGKVSGRWVMVQGNDATVKAGAYFPATVKKQLRGQRIAYECQLPVIYLVDSAGAFLPLQDEIFPDEDDFGRIFRNNSVLSAAGVPQFAAVMGNCIAGGSYLPVLCDKLLMTEGSSLALAGPALVKAAIGQEVDHEELSGAKMHAEISGTADFYEPDDHSCINRLRHLAEFLPADSEDPAAHATQRPVDEVYDIVKECSRKPYDMHQLIECFVDKDSVEEYRAGVGKTLITKYAHIGGHRVGIIANHRNPITTKEGGIEIGGVIYPESADKGARFIMDCNQMKIPIIFLQDVMGFMVGRDAEQSGIIRSGAKLVNAISNSIVPKITLLIGSSFGAGAYALCNRAYDPNFIIAWPNAKNAVMGADQSSNTLFTLLKRKREQAGEELSEEEAEAMKEKVRADYERTMDIRYAASRGWVDAIIEPHRTHEVLASLVHLCKRREPPKNRPFHTGVIQT